MTKDKTLQGTFSGCSAEGSFTPLAEFDPAQAKDMAMVALTDFDTLKEWGKKAPKESGQWNAIFKLAYDTLHTLTEVLLLFDKVKARTHECAFAFLCHKHPELEFDWNFCERIRTVRNRSIYYGKPISYNLWKEHELQITVYIKTLREAIEKRLKGKGL